MNKLLIFIILIGGGGLTACSGLDDNEIIYSINFGESYITIMSSDDETLTYYDKIHLNYFNIIKVEDEMYFLYYLAFGEDTNGTDLSQRMLFAYSKDLQTWVKKLPNKRHNIVMENIADASVSYFPNNEYPFKLICRQQIDGANFLVIYKSKNGYDFLLDNYLLKGKFDTQNTIIDENGNYRIFTRLWNDNHTIRMIGSALYDSNYVCIEPLHEIGIKYVYNPAAIKLANECYLLLPSYMNDLENPDKSDEMSLKSYILTSNGITEISNNLSQKDSSSQIFVSPGIIEYKGNKYISYVAKDKGHNSSEFSKSYYRIIKVDINKRFVINSKFL